MLTSRTRQPAEDEIAQLVGQRVAPWTVEAMAGQILRTLKHLKAWDIAVSNNPSARSFLVLEGDFDLGSTLPSTFAVRFPVLAEYLPLQCIWQELL